MATVPLSGTNIRLLSGVSFNQDYKHTRWFDNVTDQTNWFLGKTVVATASNHNYQRKDSYISIGMGIDSLWGADYLMFQNATYNNKWFYAFITKLDYVNKERTNVYFQIDVIQTWMFDFTFQPSYVVREHMQQVNADGTPYLHHQDEGLDYGNEYDIVDVQQFLPYGGVYFLVIACKQPMHTSTADGTTAGTIKTIYNGGVTPLNYYVHPFRLDGSNPAVSLGTISPILSLLTAMYSNTGSINNIVSLYVSDYLGMDLPYNSSTNTVTMDSTFFDIATVTDASSASFTTVYFKGIDFYSPKTVQFGNVFDNFKAVNETKLKMSPYSIISLEDFKGNRVDYKPEYIGSLNPTGTNDNSLKVTVRGSMGVSNKVAYTIDNYNSSTLTSGNQQTVSLESGMIDNNPNDVPIIADMLAAYLQGNRNSLANQKQTLYMNASIDGIAGVTGAVAGVMTGSVLATVNSVTSGAKGLGNDLMAIQGINAKLKDINNQPPQLASMGSNSAFDYGNGYQGVYIVRRQIKQEYIDKLTDFFNMFGYKSNRVKVPNLHTRQNWNFVQTQSCYITGNFNNEDEQEIRNVFDNGITLWHTDDMGNYSLSNGVI